MEKKKVVDNLVVGKPDVDVAAPSHVPGVTQGNAPHSSQPGLQASNGVLRATPRRSTGINPSARAPIDPRMPVLTPA